MNEWIPGGMEWNGNALLQNASQKLDRDTGKPTEKMVAASLPKSTKIK